MAPILKLVITTTNKVIAPTTNSSLQHIPSTPSVVQADELNTSLLTDNQNNIAEIPSARRVFHNRLLISKTSERNVQGHSDNATTPTYKPGVYATTTVRSMPWLNTPAISAKSKNKRQPVVRILHEIFQECIAYTEDSFWKDILIDASRGKFPRGYSYRNFILTFRRKTKVETIEIPHDPLNALLTFTSFIRNTSGIRSVADTEQEQLDHEECLLKSITAQQGTWAGIRSSTAKRAILLQYVHDTAKSLHMTEYQRNKFKTTLNSGFLLGYFTNTSVIYEHGAIIRIKGLVLNPDTSEFYIDTASSETPKINKLKDWIKETEYLNPDSQPIYKSVKDVDFIKLWNKFVSTLGSPITPTSVVPATPSMTTTVNSVQSTPRLNLSTPRLSIVPSSNYNPEVLTLPENMNYTT